MVLFFFLAPVAAWIIGGLATIIITNKVIGLISIDSLSLDSSRDIARTHFGSINSRVKVILQDPNRYNVCDIGLFNPKTNTIEEIVKVEYNEMEFSLKKKLQSTNNFLILD